MQNVNETESLCAALHDSLKAAFACVCLWCVCTCVYVHSLPTSYGLLGFSSEHISTSRKDYPESS